MFYFVFFLDTFFSEPNRESKLTKRLFTITNEINSEVFFSSSFLASQPCIYVMKQVELILMDSKYIMQFE